MNLFRQRIRGIFRPADAERAAIDRHIKAGNCGSPYLNARAEWLERYGSYINRATQWRRMAFLSIIVAVLSIAGNVIQLNQSKVVRYFVTVDELGKTVAEKISESNRNSTPELVVQSVIAELITNWRSVTPDTELQKRMMGYLSTHTASTARGILKEWYVENSPYKTAKDGRIVNVEIKGRPLAVSRDSYHVEWTEIVRNLQGSEMIREKFDAILTVAIIPPATEEAMLANPGGVYVVNISTSKVLN